MDLMERLWEKAEPQVYISREQFFKNLTAWEVETHQDDTFITIVHGPEFHFDSLTPGTPLLKATVVGFLNKIIAKHGHAITRTPHDDARQQRFNKTLGFVEIGRDEYYVIFRIERIRGCR